MTRRLITAAKEINVAITFRNFSFIAKLFFSDSMLVVDSSLFTPFLCPIVGDDRSFMYLKCARSDWLRTVLSMLHMHEWHHRILHAYFLVEI